MLMGLCIIYTDLIYFCKNFIFILTQVPQCDTYKYKFHVPPSIIPLMKALVTLNRGFYLLKSIQRQTTQRYMAKVPFNGDDFITINIKIHLTPTNYDICVWSKVWIFSETVEKP